MESLKCTTTKRERGKTMPHILKEILYFHISICLGIILSIVVKGFTVNSIRYIQDSSCVLQPECDNQCGLF